MPKKKNGFSFVVVVLLLLLLCSNGVSGMNCNPGEGDPTHVFTSGMCTEYVATEKRCKELVQKIYGAGGRFGVTSDENQPKGCVRHEYYPHDHNNEDCRRLRLLGYKNEMEL